MPPNKEASVVTEGTLTCLPTGRRFGQRHDWRKRHVMIEPSFPYSNNRIGVI